MSGQCGASSLSRSRSRRASSRVVFDAKRKRAAARAAALRDRDAGRSTCERSPRQRLPLSRPSPIDGGPCGRAEDAGLRSGDPLDAVRSGRERMAQDAGAEEPRVRPGSNGILPEDACHIACGAAGGAQHAHVVRTTPLHAERRARGSVNARVAGGRRIRLAVERDAASDLLIEPARAAARGGRVREVHRVPGRVRVESEVVGGVGGRRPVVMAAAPVRLTTPAFPRWVSVADGMPNAPETFAWLLPA
jgi:hypothetical protein